MANGCNATRGSRQGGGRRWVEAAGSRWRGAARVRARAGVVSMAAEPQRRQYNAGHIVHVSATVGCGLGRNGSSSVRMPGMKRQRVE